MEGKMKVAQMTALRRIETTGSEAAARAAIHAAKKGAQIVLVGYGPTGEMGLPIGGAIDKELALKTIFRYRHMYLRAIEAVAGGLAAVGRIVTDTFAFDDIQAAMEQCVEQKAKIVKAVIRFGK